ncbi:hypothetical protein D3C71_1819640 [compost metagenome]
MVVATLLQVTVVKTAEAPRKTLGAIRAGSIRVIEVPLRTQEIHLYQRLENGRATRFLA